MGIIPILISTEQMNIVFNNTNIVLYLFTKYQYVDMQSRLFLKVH